MSATYRGREQLLLGELTCGYRAPGHASSRPETKRLGPKYWEGVNELGLPEGYRTRIGSSTEPSKAGCGCGRAG